MKAGTWGEYLAELEALRRAKERVVTWLYAIGTLVLCAGIGVMLAWRG